MRQCPGSGAWDNPDEAWLPPLPLPRSNKPTLEWFSNDALAACRHLSTWLGCSCSFRPPDARYQASCQVLSLALATAATSSVCAGSRCEAATVWECCSRRDASVTQGAQVKHEVKEA